MANQADSYNSPVDFRITQNPDTNLTPEVKAGVTPLYAAMQQVIQAFINNCGIGQQPPASWSQLATQAIESTILSANMGRIYVTASETISFGAAVNFFLSGGILQVRNANATNNTKPCQGFCSTVGGIAAAGVGECILTSGIASISGLTVGTRYFLSTTNGLITNVAPVAAGNIEQYIGFALTTTALYFNTHYWIQH